MRLYVSETRRRAIAGACFHAAMGIALLIWANVSVLVNLIGLYHLGVAVAFVDRWRELGKVESGYVDVTPGINVIRLDPRRRRDREPRNPRPN